MKKYSFLFLVASLFVLGCEEKDKIAQAQACLDAVPSSSPSQASNCLAYVDGDDSQQADIIRCSALLMSGGLTTQKMVNAYKALSGTTGSGATVTNKEAVFISTLVLDNPSLTSGYTTAQQGDVYCQKTQVKGLMYISGLAVMGTMLAKVASDIGGAFSNPPTEAQVNAAISDCVSGSPTSSSCNPTTVGNVATTVANSYCSSANADQSVCTEVNSAIATSGGNTAKIGNALLCLLKKGTYIPASDSCT